MIFEDCNWITNPSLVGHIQQRLLIDDPDGIPGEHRIAEPSWHSRRRMDGDIMLVEQSDQVRQGSVPAKAYAVILWIVLRVVVHRPATGARRDRAMRISLEVIRPDSDLYRPVSVDGAVQNPWVCPVD